MSVAVSGRMAELLVSPDYRQALTAAYEADPETYHEQRDAAQIIAVEALADYRDDAQAAWEMRRQSTLTELGGYSLGAFNMFLHARGGEAPQTGKSIEDLGQGSAEVVRTNSRITSLKNIYEDPIDYLDAALETIDARAASLGRRKAVGPENYATAIKNFTDKYVAFPSDHLDKAIIKDQVSRCVDGFIDIAKHDKPNFVEMTNLFFAIRHLPVGSFDASYTTDIIKYSLELLPDFDNDYNRGNGTLSIMIAALSRIDLSSSGEAAANLIDLALRKGKKMETTRDYLQTLAAIGNLPATPAANRSFHSFLAARNDLENALDINGCEAATERLLAIGANVIDDPQLTQYAKQLSGNIALRATKLYPEKVQSDDSTDRYKQQLKETVQQIIRNYSQL